MPTLVLADALTVSKLTASDTAFGIVFGLFIAAFVVLAVVTITWAVRRDRPRREAWRRRMVEGDRSGGGPRGNGRRPGRPGPPA
jgi:hypothetical protein